jgi:hypothetical protein
MTEVPQVSQPLAPLIEKKRRKLKASETVARNEIDVIPSTPQLISKERRTIERKKFVKAFIEHGGNATRAAQEVRPVKYESARTLGMRLMRREDIKREIAEALEEHGISMGYVLNVRRKFVDVGVRQLEGKKGANEPWVSPKDVNSHLQGIEGIMKRLEEDGGKNPSHVGLHLHLDSKSVPEVIAKRNELSSWFNEILDGDIDTTGSEES